MVIGKKIKELRNEAGYTQDDLGKKLSVTRQAVSNWERGRTQPDLDAIKKICEIFSVSLNYFGDEETRSIETDLSKASVYESKITKYIFALSPLLIFVLLLPFMLEKVPYHTDLMGNIDRSGSRLYLFGSICISSILILYLYSNLNKKRILFSLIIMASLSNITLFLLASVVETENFYRGFIEYIAISYGNQISFTIFVVMILFFMIVDLIPLNSMIGIRNSVTMKSTDAWRYVHIKSKLVIACCSIINLLIFLLPVISNFNKMIFSFITVILVFSAIIVISRKYKEPESE